MSDDVVPPAPEKSSDGQKMVKATAGIGAFVVAGSALAGLITKMVLSRLLGRGAVADAYNFIYGLIQSVFRSWDKLVRPVFLPVLAEERQRVGEKESWRFVSSFFNIQAMLLALITVAAIAFAPPIVRVLSEFTGTEAAKAESLAGRFLAVMAPAAMFLALASTGYLLLNSYKRFQLAAFGDNVFVKIVPLAALVGLYWLFGIYALVLGIVLGALAKLALYAWGLRRELRDYRPRIELASPAMKRIGWLLLPLSVGVLGAFVRDLIERWFMTRAGGATLIPYSRAPVDIPVQLLPVALSIAIFPFLSDYVARNEHEKLFDVLGRAFRIIVLAFLPLTVGLVLLAHPLIDVVFGGGQYTPDDVRLTAQASQWYALGYVFFGLEIVMLQFFYAARDTIAPTWTGILTSALQIGILWLTVDAMGTSSFNLAYSASKALKVLILAALLARAFPHEHLWKQLLKRTLPTVGKVALVTAVMGLAVYGLDCFLRTSPTGDRMSSWIAQAVNAAIAGIWGLLHRAKMPRFSLEAARDVLRLSVSSCAGMGIFAAGVHLLGVEEWHDALGWVKKKLKRS